MGHKVEASWDIHRTTSFTNLVADALFYFYLRIACKAPIVDRRKHERLVKQGRT